MITFAKLGKYGRIGNTMFQAATTIALAHRNNDEYKFPRWDHSKDFNIPQDRFGKVHFTDTFNEPHFHYAGIPYKRDLNLMGYFQSYKYFQDEDHIITPLLMPKVVIDKVDKVSIHVRRTDYLVHKGCYNILNMGNYYERAMEASGGKKFLVFSDDIDWCKKHFIGNEFDFSEGERDIKDLSIMIACSGHIIANSSYSWWAAWLDKKGGKVIAPRAWFGPELSPTHDTKDLLPEWWVKI